MASEAAGYREDVDQARRRFAEFRQGACGAIAATGRAVGDGGEVGAAGWDHRYGAGAGRGPAEPSEVDGSIGASRFRKAAKVSAPASAGREWRARLRGTAGGEHGNGNQLCGGSRIRPGAASCGWS